MNIKQEIIDAIKIVVDSAIRKSCPQIMFGVVVAVGNSKKCTVRINQIDYELSYYGETAPNVNQKYPVFVPFGKMNLAFILVSGGGSGGSGTSDYNQLSNRPSINNVTLSGNQTASQLRLFDGDYNNLSNKPTIPSTTSQLTNDSGFLTEHQSLTGYATETYVDNHHDSTKEDAISDLATIRSGAALGATSVQPEAGKGLFSGNYNDLTNKPTIPSVVTEATVSGWGFTKNTGTYNKPSDGIPKSDLSSSVQASLNKADTAIQSSDLATVATTGSYNDLTDKPTPYSLPTATTDSLGGIKVGAGLSITNGLLSVSGGGIADAVEWDNVLHKPTTISGYGITDAPTIVKFTLSGTIVASTKTPSQLATAFTGDGYVLAKLYNSADSSYEALDKVYCNASTIILSTIHQNTLGGGFIYKKVIGNITNNTWAYEIS